VTVTREKLLGVWKLVSYEFRLADGIMIRPMGQGVQGMLIYDANGFMSLHVIDPERPKFTTEDWMSGTAEEAKSALDGCMAYYGTFEVNERKRSVVHHIEGSSFPNWSGIDREQFVEFKDDRLILLTLPMTMSGEQLVGQLIWKRASRVAA
jgi:hypothetical protein